MNVDINCLLYTKRSITSVIHRNQLFQFREYSLTALITNDVRIPSRIIIIVASLHLIRKFAKHRIMTIITISTITAQYYHAMKTCKDFILRKYDGYKKNNSIRTPGQAMCFSHIPPTPRKWEGEERIPPPPILKCKYFAMFYNAKSKRKPL